MAIYRTLAAAGLLAVCASATSAEDSLLDYVKQSCESDLASYCSQVTPGHGRLLHCVAAHEDKLSGQCGYALYQAASLLEQLTVAITYLAQSCGPELQAHCSDIEMGGGKVMACLEAHRAELGDDCSNAIAQTVAE